MKISNNYNNNYNTNFCAKLDTKNSSLSSEKRESVEKKFEHLTQDYPDDTFTLSRNDMIVNIHNGDLTANFVEVLNDPTDYNYKINRKEDDQVVSDLVEKYKGLREVSDMYKDALEFAEKLKEKYSIYIGDSYRELEISGTCSGVDCIMGSLLDVLRQARYKYKNKTWNFRDTHETISYSSCGSIPEEKDAWIKYKDIKIPFPLF